MKFEQKVSDASKEIFRILIVIFSYFFLFLFMKTDDL